MDITKLQFINYSDARINILNYKMEPLFFEMTDVITPFGNEIVSDVTINSSYVNWEFSDEMKNIIVIVTNAIKNEVIKRRPETETWTFKDSIKLYNGKNLFKTKNVNNRIFLKNINYNIKITIDSVWLYKKNKTFGILWTVM